MSDGWHCPSDDEWQVLEMALGMTWQNAGSTATWRGTDEGGQLKDEGYVFWEQSEYGSYEFFRIYGIGCGMGFQ